MIFKLTFLYEDLSPNTRLISSLSNHLEFLKGIQMRQSIRSKYLRVGEIYYVKLGYLIGKSLPPLIQIRRLLIFFIAELFLQI